ncbi:MAG: pyridoxamine 5'-phosphate oxidase family protein [Deltaproteobacteria bacterium]|nr:pyridoxamine 5'-phosphate oxidase family protein [Deltaproteobacteria bacterium]
MKLTDLTFHAMGPQPAFAPGDLECFVAAPRIAVLSYVKRDGTPAQAPIWYQYRDGRFFMVTATTSPKAKALARAKRACLTIQDEVPPYRAVIVDGDVTLADAPLEGGVNSWLATHYFGRLGGREYERMTAEENRKTGLSLIAFEPVRVRGFDNHRLIGGALRWYMRLRNALPIPRRWL